MHAKTVARIVYRVCLSDFTIYLKFEHICWEFSLTVQDNLYNPLDTKVK